MRTRTADVSVPAAVEAAYRPQRARVDSAYQRVHAAAVAPHPPAQARDAARDLAVALREATATATRALEAVGATTAHRPRHQLRRGRADRTVPAAVHHWSVELVRLAEIDIWLRRTTLDDLGVHVPVAVQIANYAASGPHVAGLGFAGAAVAQSIGIDLTATIDAVSQAATSDPVAAARTSGLTRAA